MAIMMTQDNNVRKTALFELHKKSNAKMVPFGGWLMPVSYSGVLAEHKAVREACGLFDVSHMGEIFVSGAAATAWLQKMTINDLNRLKPGEGQYSAILHPNGGMIDDLIIYRLEENRYLICANASNTDKDYKWLHEHAAGAKVTVADESSAWSQLAVQGPLSQRALQGLLNVADHHKFASLSYMQIMPANLFGHASWIARTGYTGEHGYEIYLPNSVAGQVWSELLTDKSQVGIKPIGLGARDTLRLESCYLLYGNDMNDAVSPLEAGIGWAVRLTNEKGDFIGRDALLAQKASGIPRSLLAFVMVDDGIPRHGMLVFKDGREIGQVTSGSVLPTLGEAGGLALLSATSARVGDTIEVDVRGKRKLARVVQKPLYKAKVKV